MASPVTVPEFEYALAERALLSERLLSALTFADVLAQPAVVTATTERIPPRLESVTIRRRDSEISVEIGATGSQPRSFIKSVKEIAALLILAPGWNSYSAKPIAPQNAERAILLVWELLQLGVPAPLVVPRVRGGIQLEWHTEIGDLEIYIDSPDQISFFAEHVESGDSTEAPVTGHEAELRAWIHRISGE